MKHAAYDTETFRIGKNDPYPQLVCAQFTDETGDQIYSYWEHKAGLRAKLEAMLRDDQLVIHSTNGQYDWIVTCLAYPELEPLVWEKHARGLIWSVDIAERLSNLASFGSIEYMPLTEGRAKEIGYSQADMEIDYLGVDRTEAKKGGVRLTYDIWATTPITQWPQDYIEYALDDTRNLFKIVALQWKRFQDRGVAESVAAVIGFRTAAAFALGWGTYNGHRTNPAAIRKMDETTKFERDLARYPALIREVDGLQVGIITAGQPERDDARGSKDHVEGCPRKSCGCPVKRVAGKKPSLSRSRLASIIHYVSCWAKKNHGIDIDLFLTDGGIEQAEVLLERRHLKLECDHPLLYEHPEWISTDESNYSQVMMFSEEIRQYAKREEWGQIEKQYVGRLFWDEGNGCTRYEAERQMNRAVPESWFNPGIVDIRPVDKIHYCFEPLVNSGRTGSRASKLYPSMNGQNVDPRVRGCMRARENHVTLSQDIVGLELISAAWRCESLGITSVLAALLKGKEDAHSYLGAALAQKLAKPENIPASFMQACNQFAHRAIDRFTLYKAFLALKKGDDQEKKFWKRWRTFAKPVGLGCWGALGKNVMHMTANSAPYHLDVTVEECAAGIEIWRESFPESAHYFRYVQKMMVDQPFSKTDEKTGKVKDRYKYQSPLGMVRRNVSWNEVSNGFALQTPSAEGMLAGVFLISRACRDWTQNSPLYGCFFLDFIHDEILTDVPVLADYNQTILRVDESARLLQQGLGLIFPGFPIGVESVLMHTWDKFAKEGKDAEGRLVPVDLPTTSLAA